jgi:hypothetical protein
MWPCAFVGRTNFQTTVKTINAKTGISIIATANTQPEKNIQTMVNKTAATPTAAESDNLKRKRRRCGLIDIGSAQIGPKTFSGR